MARRGLSIGLLLLGVVVGVSLRHFFGTGEADDSHLRDRASDEQRFAALEAKLRSLEAARASGPGPADLAPRPQPLALAVGTPDASAALPVEQAGPPQLPRETPPETKARVLAWWQTQLGAHAAEPKDALWAQNQERELSDGLAALKLSGAVLRTSCQTTLCRSDIRFDDFQHAVSEYERILHASTSPGCSRRVLLPDPVRADEPYEATAIFECKRGTDDAVKGM